MARIAQPLNPFQRDDKGDQQPHEYPGSYHPHDIRRMMAQGAVASPDSKLAGMAQSHGPFQDKLLPAPAMHADRSDRNNQITPLAMTDRDREINKGIKAGDYKDQGIDHDFLHAREGYEETGYTLDPEKYGNSGVTIGYGFDLGQYSEKDLRNMGLDEDVTTCFRPFLGKKGQAAVDALKNNPGLTIERSVANTLYNHALERNMRKLREAWKDASDLPFDSLPSEVKTVMASVVYQYGNLHGETKNFWKYLTQGRWKDAYDELMDFGDAYSGRRELEAALLAKLF